MCKLLKQILFIHLILYYSCQNGQWGNGTPTLSKELTHLKETKLETPDGRQIKTLLCITERDQMKGLSGIRSHQFPLGHGMLFYYPSEGIRSFWMPDTYFDLDLFYLNAQLKVQHIQRNLKHHPGLGPNIPKALPVKATHVLELRSDDAISKSIDVGDQFLEVEATVLKDLQKEPDIHH